MTATTVFEVAVVAPLDQVGLEMPTFVTTEPAALEAAAQLVCRARVEQVSIEALIPDAVGLYDGTFAVRHVKHDGRTIDEGEWSCWEDGQFTGHRPTLEGWLA